MKRLILVILSFLSILSNIPMMAQSWDVQFKLAESIRAEYGENSFEYAEALWRLGNVSDSKGEQSAYDCYEKAQKILESIDARDSFIYCTLFWNFFWYYWNSQDWTSASDSVQKYIKYAKPWINKEWKGNMLRDVDIAAAYYMLALTYFTRLDDDASAIEAFKECVYVVEEHHLLKEFPDVWIACQGIWLGYENMNDYKSSVEWHLKCIDAVGHIMGDTSDEYLNELSSLRYCYFKLGDFDSAEKTNLYLIGQIEKKDAEAGIDCVTDSLYVEEYENILSLCIAHNRYRKTISYGIKLSGIYKARGEENTSSYLSLLDNLILAYHNTNDYAGAYSLYDRFETLVKKFNLDKTDDFWLYSCLKAEALTYLYKLSEYAKVIEDWGKLTAELYGRNSVQDLIYTYQVANQQAAQDRQEEAGKGVEKCYRIIGSGECVFESKADSIVIMASIHNLEGMVYTASDTRRAESALLSAIEENRMVGRADCTPILNLGLLYYKQKRDLAQAKEYFEKARQMLESTGDNYSIQYITVLNNLGTCYQDLGEDSYAIAIFDLAGRTVLSNYGKQHALYGTIEQNKSVFYTSISNYHEAIICCKEALECYRQVFGEDSEKYGTCLQNLGLMYQYVGDYTRSEETLLAAIPVLEALDSPYCIHAYTNLLTVFAFEKDMGKVAELAERAETMLKENHWEESDAAVSLYGSIGYAMLINSMPGSKAYFGYALNLLDKIGAKASIQYHSGLLYYCLSAFMDQSQTEDIIPVITDSYKSQYLSNAAFFNAPERESLIAGPRFSQTSSILFSSRQEGKYDTRLYDFLLFNKGLLLGTSVNYAKAVYDSGNDDIISQYERLLDLNRFLSGEQPVENIGVPVDEAKTEVSALEREITLYLRQHGGYTGGLDYTYSDIRKSLEKDELAIEFVSYLNCTDNTVYYAALVAKREWSKPKYVQLCKKEDLDKLVSLSPDKLYGESVASESAFDLIWGPLDSCLLDIRTVYFSPAGYINSLSVEHLYNGERYFDAIYDVVRLSSTREICADRPRHKYATAALYGGLRYDEDDATMIAESRNMRNPSSILPERFRGFDAFETRNGWEYLPGTLEEVNRISSIVSKNRMNYSLYTESKGNEESFKALSGNSPDILHIATHGFYLTSSAAERKAFFATNPFSSQKAGSALSPLKRSGLLLAGGNKAWKGETVPKDVEDGVLTASEIASLDLKNCDVVILSACETGLGDITDEGVFGLQRAFKNAGANTIIMSLWEVDDQATSLMMQTFYRNLVKGKGKRESFITARQTVKKKYPDPRYWAAFIMLD